jgi:hypothetical protein
MPAGTLSVDIDEFVAELTADDIAFSTNAKGIILKSSTGRQLRVVAVDSGDGAELSKDEDHPIGGA